SYAGACPRSALPGAGLCVEVKLRVDCSSTFPIPDELLPKLKRHIGPCAKGDDREASPCCARSRSCREHINSSSKLRSDPVLDTSYCKEVGFRPEWAAGHLEA